MASFLYILVGIILASAVAIYFFGIPPELKRKAEVAALKTMGENKASYLVKDQISKIPASDQEDVKELKKGLSGLSGGALQNPLGEAGGEAADTLTSPFTGR